MKVPFIAAFITVTAIVVSWATVLWPDSAYDPMYGSGFDEPQQVVEMIVVVGGSITVVGVVKCNKEDFPISVSGVSQWRRIDDGGVTLVPDPPRGGGKLQPGCYEPRTFDNKLPEGVTPGLWVYEGINSTYHGQQRQSLHWTTEPFRVTR